MEEKLIDVLNSLSGILHWFGKYHNSNLMIRLRALLIEHNIETIEQLKQALK